MIPKVTDTLLSYRKLGTVTLLLAVNSSFVSAKTPCIVDNNANNYCMSEQIHGPKVKKKQQGGDTFAIDQLYYSGGVLHNKTLGEQFTPNQELNPPTAVDRKHALNDSISRSQNQGTSPESISGEIRVIFQNIDEVGRKSIQKCLKFGTYTTKIDGIWGQQTHNAISNFKKDANHLKQNDEANLFSKIKNVFSRKAFCQKLLNDTFK